MLVYMWGSAECDQFNLLNEDGEEEPETKRPYKIDVKFNIAQVSCGGLHTLFLTDQGKVYSQGCNDGEVLGRGDGDQINCKEPGLVDLPFVDMICAGDVHSVAANSRGKVYFWGFYRNNNGPMGEQIKKPQQIGLFSGTIQKILSGNNHTIVLNDDRVYSCGDGDTSVLGRLSKTRNRLKQSLNFQEIGQKHVVDVFSGGYAAFIKKKVTKTGQFAYYAWGLNNYGQLGIGNTQDQYSPVKIDKFDGLDIVNIVGGEHHTIALDSEGNLYGFGRNDDGQIALGQELNQQLKQLALEEKQKVEEELKSKKPKKVKKTKKGQQPESTLTQVQKSDQVYGYEYVTVPEKINKIENIKQIYATSQFSFALSKENEVYSWGLGQNYVLGTCQEESIYEPYKIKPTFFKNQQILAISLGGQHVVCVSSAEPIKLAEIDQSLNKEKAYSIKRPKVSVISPEVQKKVDDIVQKGLEQLKD